MRIVGKRHQIKQFPHPAIYPCTIDLFNPATVEAAWVGDESLGDKQIIPGKKDFCHDVVIVAVLFEETKKPHQKW